MKLKSSTIMEKANLILAVIAGLLMLAVYFLFLLEPTDSFFPSGYTLIRKSILHGVDMLPFILLLIFSLLQKTDKFRRARWMPVVLMGARIFVDIIAWIYRYDGDVETLSFNLLMVEMMDGYFGAILFLHLFFLLVAAVFSRWLYTFVSVGWLCMFVPTGVAVLDIVPSGRNIAWFCAYFAWYAAVLFLGITLTPHNGYIKVLCQTFERLWGEMSPNDDFALYQIADVYESNGRVYVLVNTPDEKVLVLEKNADEEGPGTMYSLIQAGVDPDELDQTWNDSAEEE